MKKTIALIIAGVIIVGSACCACICLLRNDAVDAGGDGTVVGKTMIGAGARKNARRIKMENTRNQTFPKARDRSEKPMLVLEDAEEASLDVEQKKLLADIRQALDKEDIFALRTAIARMKERAMAQARAHGNVDWTRYVARPLRSSTVSALGWFGGEAMADMVEFIADADPDVAQMAIDQFEAAMQDPTMGDRDRSEVIKLVSSTVTDEDMADWLCMEINNMRHSVGIDTMLYLNDSASDVVKAKIPETMEFFTCDDSIKTADDAQQWLQDNPDDPDDEDFYGPFEKPGE